MKAYVYILECSDKSYYIGYTTNLEKRIKSHNNKTGSKYTRTRTPVKYVYTKEFENKIQAMSAEKYLKQLTREQKNKIINGKICIEDYLKSKKVSRNNNEEKN